MSLRFGPRARPEDIDAVMHALWALSTFGGIGARSRRGWGSVHLTSIADSDATYDYLIQDCSNRGEFEEHIIGNLKRIVGSPYSKRPTFTAFSSDMKLVLSPLAKGEWSNALGYVSRRMNKWRSWKGDKKFPQDHDLVLDFLQGKYTKATGGGSYETKIPAFPERVIFGLPHNYFFSSRAGQSPQRPVAVEVDAVVRHHHKLEEFSRRASPLLLTLKQIGEQHVALHTYLPADFFPAGAEIRLLPRDGRKPAQIRKREWDNEHLEESSKAFTENYGVLEGYLNELTVAAHRAHALDMPHHLMICRDLAPRLIAYDVAMLGWFSCAREMLGSRFPRQDREFRFRGSRPDGM